MDAGGRWWLMSPESCDYNDALQQLCWQLLQRYGVVSRAIILREPKLPPWRELLYVFRRLEARDEIHGGRFVEQLSGEQFALQEVASTLGQYCHQNKELESGLVAIAACDPANLLHLLNDKAKLANIAGNKVLLKDGVPIALLSGDKLSWLTAQESISEQQALQAFRSPSAAFGF